MCFSPEASFTGGVIISAIGALTITKVHKSSQLVFASIPLFFGIQQIAEGFVWLALRNTDLIIIQRISTYLFLILAQVIWPTMIPLSVWLMEEKPGKKKFLSLLVVPGILLSLYYSFCLLSFSVNPQIDGYHILYNNGFPAKLSNPAFAVYLTVTITPLFVSGIKKIWLMGILMTLSCIVTGIFYQQYMTSVWCFFAALISVVVLWILSESMRSVRSDRLKLLITDPDGI